MGGPVAAWPLRDGIGRWLRPIGPGNDKKNLGSPKKMGCFRAARESQGHFPRVLQVGHFLFCEITRLFSMTSIRGAFLSPNPAPYHGIGEHSTDASPFAIPAVSISTRSSCTCSAACCRTWRWAAPSNTPALAAPPARPTGSSSFNGHLPRALPRLQRLHRRLRRPPQPPDRHRHLRPLLLPPHLPLRVRLPGPRRERLCHRRGQAGTDPPVHARRGPQRSVPCAASTHLGPCPFAGGVISPSSPLPSSASWPPLRSVWVQDFRGKPGLRPRHSSAPGSRGPGLRRQPRRLRGCTNASLLSRGPESLIYSADPPHRAPPRPRQRPRRRPPCPTAAPSNFPKITAFNAGPGGECLDHN